MLIGTFDCHGEINSVVDCLSKGVLSGQCSSSNLHIRRTKQPAEMSAALQNFSQVNFCTIDHKTIL